MKNLELRCASYLREYFQVDLVELSKEIPPIPMQFKNKLKVILGTLGGLRFHVVYSYDDIIFAQGTRYLFNKLLSRLSDYPILFVIDELKRSTILELTERKIAHIVPFERSYIPELMVHQDKPPKNHIKQFPTGKLGILPTNIVVRFLDGAIPRTFTTADIQVKVSKASISRCIKELHDVGLIEVEMVGRSYQMKFLHSRQKIWEARESLLAKLASDVYQVPKSAIRKPTVLAGESALSIYTLLSPPQVPCYAVVMDNNARKDVAITSNTINKISMDFVNEQIGPGAEDFAIFPYHFNEISFHSKKQGLNKIPEMIELQVFPYAPMAKAFRDVEVISPIVLSLSGYQERDPRTRTSFEELNEKVLESLVQLDQQDLNKEYDNNGCQIATF